MIRFEDVTKSLGGRVVLDEINLDVKESEIVFVVGFSGAGKSVTLRHMVRLLTPDRGRVTVGDACISEAAGRELEMVRSRFGYLFQGSALLGWMTAGENVALPLRETRKMKQAPAEQLARETLARVNLGDVFSKYPSELSGGMRKRVALARAIVTTPDIILYDEPTSGLDPVTSRSIDSLITELRDSLGATSVVVTHDLHSALSIGSRILMLEGGKIVEDSTPEGFVHSENEHVRSFLESQYINRKGPWERKVLNGQ